MPHLSYLAQFDSWQATCHWTSIKMINIGMLGHMKKMHSFVQTGLSFNIVNKLM